MNINWKSLVGNIVGGFAAGYFAALASGLNQKSCIGAGIGGAATVVAGLFQKQPHMKQHKIAVPK